MHHYLKLGRNFIFPDYKPRYPRRPTFRITHYRLELSLDINDRRIDGTAAITLQSFSNNVELDAVEMEIVKVEGGEHDYDGKTLAIKLPPNQTHTVKIDYRAWPRTGVYFILPEQGSDRPPFVWSHGEPEYNRYWMPVYDYPNMKFTTELIATVPEPLEVVSNGELVGVRRRDGRITWHWSLEVPHTAYLMSFVAGVFDKHEEQHDGVQLGYYVPKGMGSYIKNSFSKTADIIKFFSEYLSYPYPYKSYKQVCVPEFVVGGMENTTATTLTDLTLHDDHAHIDFSSDPLVAHELAHQWFGDLVTCSDWSHIWLNESFATYLENLYVRHDKGEDEFLYELYNDLKSYLDEYQRRYSRPVVLRLYKYPDELFDRHSYPKGGLVLHTISNFVGEGRFRKGLTAFLRRHEFSTADTEDFRKALERESGTPLEHLFEQLVYSSGHPVVNVSYRWDSENNQLRLNVKQNQGDDTPETYDLELEFSITAGEETVVRKIPLTARESTVFIPLKTKQTHVCVDPKLKVLRALQVERPVEEVLRAVKECRSVVCRLEMIEFLTKQGGRRVVEALEWVVENDGFWGVSYHAAKALGQIKSEESKMALLNCLKKVKHPKVRRGIVEGLGSFEGDKEAAEALKAVVEDLGESYYVRQSACISLGRIRRADGFETLMKALGYRSHAESVACGAVAGLAEMGTDEAFKHVLERTKPSNPTPVRLAAVAGLAKFPEKQQVYDTLDKLSTDPNERIRGAVVAAARELMDRRLLKTLDRMADQDLNGRISRNAREVAARIREHLEKGVEYKALREEIEKVRDENRRISERLYRMEGKLG